MLYPTTNSLRVPISCLPKCKLLLSPTFDHLRLLLLKVGIIYRRPNRKDWDQNRSNRDRRIRSEVRSLLSDNQTFFGQFGFHPRLTELTEVTKKVAIRPFTAQPTDSYPRYTNVPPNSQTISLTHPFPLPGAYASPWSLACTGARRCSPLARTA